MSRAAEVCQACGLCCDGTLFTVVPLRAAERAPPGLELIDRSDGTRAFRQCCAALDGTRCTAYDARPHACREFTCLLYAALEADEVDPREALAIVAEARARIAEVERLLPPRASEAEPTAVMQRARQRAAAHALLAAVSTGDGVARAEEAAAHDRFVEVLARAELLLRRQFSGRG